MPVTRRQLLVGATSLAAVSALGCSRDPDLDAESFDVCVIGSGFAGTLLARRTVANGIKTVMIEAGSHPRKPGNNQIAAAFTTANSGVVSFPVDGTRRIALGGTSNLWAGVVTRLWPNDFRMQSEYGRMVDWPISYGELEPYYCEAERLLGVEGDPFVEGGEPPRKCAYPIERPEPYEQPGFQIEGKSVRYTPLTGCRRNGKLYQLVDVEIPEFQNHPLGLLVQSQQAMKIVTLDGKTIDHVETRSANGAVFRFRARHFVLAAGVVESPRLLLLSTSKWFPTGLGNTHDLVGRHFNAHPSFQGTFAVRDDVKLPLTKKNRTYSLSDAYRREGMNGVHYQLDVLANHSVNWRCNPEIEPRAENRIVLTDQGRDFFGNPIPSVILDYSRPDKRTIQRCKAFLTDSHRELSTSPLQRHFKWRGHPSGTVRMGHSEIDGVVDRNNKMFGVANLYVSGACTFPTSGTANPTNTVVALTLRLAAHILAKA